MADTINIEGMNEQMARTDSLVAKLAQDVDKLSTSFSNLSKSANVEKMLGTINGAFEMMSNMSGTAAKNVTSRVSTIINDLTRLSEAAGKAGVGLGGGIKLDFIQGTNLNEKQKEFNAAILKMAENYEKAQANVAKYKNELLSLFANSKKSDRSTPAFLKEEASLLEKIAKEQSIVDASAQAHLLVMQKTAETQKIINQGKQSEKNATAELTKLYKELNVTKLKSDELFSRVNVKGNNVGPIPFQQEEEALMERYNKKIAELEASIKRLAEKHPELAAKIKETFDTQYIEKSIGIRDKQAAAIDKVTQQIEKQRQKEEELAAAEQRRLLIEQRSTTQGALDFSAGVKTANQAKEAIQYLTAARNNLDRTDAKYKENLKRLNDEIRRNKQFIEEVTGASSRLQTRTFSLLQSTKQLAEGFGIMFSAYGISNFIRKLVQVTGEFELQQTALASIIDSADKAQTMFGELQKMAVASPYSIQQLVSYNKQLAAYRVETDKLLPVLKQLGDVAAGVGVDMQRLILAYGQVKAANYLRGQELRQFSEAGINILGELARRFSDAEGKVVSTGEVFDRVSKRLVKFEDVAAVFDDLTKKGGIFYDMQAKQAETVRGQLMNLKDAFQIALYNIGQETNGAIRSFLSLLKLVVKNLDLVVKAGASALGLFLAWKTALAASNLLTHSMAANFKMMQMSMPKITSLFKTIGKHPLAAAASVALTILTSIVVQIVKARKRIAELRKESIETFSAMTESLKEFQEAMAKSGDYQLGVDESGRKKYKLIKTDNLKNDLRIVKDFIEDLEKQGIELKPGFDLEYSEQDKDKQAEKLAEFLEDVQTTAADLIAAHEGGKKIVAKFADPLEQEIKGFSKSLDKLKEQIRVSSQGIEDELVSEGKKIGISDSEIQRAVDNLKRLRTGQYESLDEAREMWSVVEKLQDSITKKTGKRLAYEKESLKISKRFTEMFSVYNRGQLNVNREFENLLTQFAKFKGVDVDHLLQSMSDPKKGEQIVNQFMQFTKGAFQESGKQLTDDIWNQALHWLEKNQKVNPFTIKPVLKTPSVSGTEDLRLDWQKEYNAFVKGLNDDIAKLIPSPEIAKVLKYTVDEIGVDEADITRLKQASALQQSIKENEEQLAALQKTKSKSKEDDIKLLELLIKNQKEAKEWLVGPDKSNTKAAKDISSEFEKMVKFIRQLRSEYDKLSKTFPSEDAAKRVADSFRDEFEAMPKFFQDVFGGDISNIAFMSPEQVVESLKKIEPILTKYYSTWQKKLQIFFEKNKAEEQVEIDVEFKKKTADEINRQIEELFSNYEIQLQLTELGLTSEDAKNIFNLDAIDLNVLGTKLADFHDIIMEQFGEDEINKYKEFEKRFTDIYEKSQMERLKKYAKFLQIEMSERVKVEMETLKQLAELESTPALYGAEGTEQAKQRERIRQRIKEERDKKVDSLIWKEFQQTDLYIELFNDLGNASNQMLLQMYKKLEKMKGSLKGLSAQELKAIEQQMENLRNQIVERNPFDAAIKAAKDFKKLKEELSKDDTLKKVLGVDEIGNFRKTMKQGIKEIGDALYSFYVDQENNGERYEKGLYEQLHVVEELYQAARERDRAASELMKMDINFGEEWFDPKASLKAAKDAVSLKERKIALAKDQTEIDQLKTEQIHWQLVVDELNKYISAMNTLGVKSGESTEKLGDKFDKIKKTIEDLEKVYGKLTDAQKQLLLNLSDTSEAIKTTAQTLDSVQDVYETWMENLDYLGGATDELTEAQAKLGSAIFKSLKDVMNLTSKILDTIPNIATAFSAAGTAINSSMGIIGLIAEALQLVITLVKAIGQFHDDNISASISTIQRKVDLLTRSYEDLSEAFESAFDANRLREFNRLMVNNLQQQRDFLEHEIALEEDKKKTDRDYVNSLKNELDDIDKKLAETSSKLYEELGGFGSDSAYKSAAEQFVDAWYNAFMETGSGLSGLEDTFDEFFVKMIKKQLMQKLADRYFNDMLSEFDELLNSGDIWENDYFWNEYMSRVPERLQEANDALAEYYSRLQGLFGAGGIGGLGNLQQGIQGVTEQTADVLATYLNTIRLYVAQDNQNMTALINWLGVGTTNDSLMSNIRLTAQNTAAINTLLQSLVPGQAHTLGGAGLKVFVS